MWSTMNTENIKDHILYWFADKACSINTQWQTASMTWKASWQHVCLQITCAEPKLNLH